MGHEEKELCKPGHLALVLILETAINILGSKQKASIVCAITPELKSLKDMPFSTVRLNVMVKSLAFLLCV
jgi:hypothetical protein